MSGAAGVRVPCDTMGALSHLLYDLILTQFGGGQRIWLEVIIPCGKGLSLSLNHKSAASFFQLKVPVRRREL